MHKLTAGSGYDYLTRQVAAQDTTEKGHATLASYYSEKGEVPGTWVGSGLAGLEDVAVGDPVTAEQMKALFGCVAVGDQRRSAVGPTFPGACGHDRLSQGGRDSLQQLADAELDGGGRAEMGWRRLAPLRQGAS